MSNFFSISISWIFDTFARNSSFEKIARNGTGAKNWRAVQSTLIRAVWNVPKLLQLAFSTLFHAWRYELIGSLWSLRSLLSEENKKMQKIIMENPAFGPNLKTKKSSRRALVQPGGCTRPWREKNYAWWRSLIGPLISTDWAHSPSGNRANADGKCWKLRITEMTFWKRTESTKRKRLMVISLF